MSEIDEQSARYAQLPICPKCGKPMQLEDLRGEVANLDSHPRKEFLYRIVCCGLVLRMEDDDAFLRAVALLKEFHRIPP
jgi:hypothetical protein